MRRFFTILIAALLIISSATTPGRAAVDLSKPSHYVEDYANVVNASQESSLNGILQELEQKTGAQYIILTVETTGECQLNNFQLS